MEIQGKIIAVLPPKSGTSARGGALLPSRDVCSWLGPAPACLGSRPQPQLRASSP